MPLSSSAISGSYMIESSPTQIEGVLVLTSNRYADRRGHFSRIFCEKELNTILDGRRIVQINHSVTLQKGTVRGMHFQMSPSREMKFVICVRGAVYDVAVDLRKESGTLLGWHAQILSEHSGLAMVIPEGCAHGFQALEANTELLYFHTAAYDREAESGLRWDDPALNIEWPLIPSGISDRDLSFQSIGSDFKGI